MKTIKLNTMRKFILSAAICAVSFTTVAQVGVGTTDPKATLDITGDKGMLLPRIADHTTLVPVDGTLDANEAGLQVYNTTTKKVMLWNGTAWAAGASSSSSNWVDMPLFSGETYKKGLEDLQTANDSIHFVKTGGALNQYIKSLDKAATMNLEGTFSGYFTRGNGTQLFSTYLFNGTSDAKAAITSGRNLGYLSFNGYTGNGTVSNLSSTIYAVSTQNWSPGNTGSDMYFRTTPNNTGSSTIKMIIKQDGKIGIGTTLPTNDLEVVGPNGIGNTRYENVAQGASFSTVSGRGNVTTPTASLNGDRVGAWFSRGHDGTDTANQVASIYTSIDGTVGTDSTPGRIQFLTTPAGSNIATEKMTIKSDGKIGIGTTSPDHTLEIAQSGGGSDTAGQGFLGVSAYGTDFWALRQSKTVLSDFIIDKNYAGAWGEAFRIQRSTGNIGVGTTGAAVAKLEVNGAIKVGNTSATAVVGMIKYVSGHFYGYNGTAADTGAGAGWAQLD